MKLEANVKAPDPVSLKGHDRKRIWLPFLESLKPGGWGKVELNGRQVSSVQRVMSQAIRGGNSHIRIMTRTSIDGKTLWVYRASAEEQEEYEAKKRKRA